MVDLTNTLVAGREYTPAARFHNLVDILIPMGEMFWCRGFGHVKYLKPLETTLPGEEVLQRSGLVLFLTDNPISLLLLHLSDAGGEGVDVVKYSLHGDGNLIGLLTKECQQEPVTLSQRLI